MHRIWKGSRSGTPATSGALGVQGARGPQRQGPAPNISIIHYVLVQRCGRSRPGLRFQDHPEPPRLRACAYHRRAYLGNPAPCLSRRIVPCFAVAQLEAMKRLAPPARRGPRRDAAPGLAPRLKPPPGSRSTWTLLPRIMMRCCAAQRHRAREGGSNPSKFEVRTKSFLLRLPRAYRACIISAGRANYEEPLRCAPLPLLLCITARGTEALSPGPVSRLVIALRGAR